MHSTRSQWWWQLPCHTFRLLTATEAWLPQPLQPVKVHDTCHVTGPAAEFFATAAVAFSTRATLFVRRVSILSLRLFRAVN